MSAPPAPAPVDKESPRSVTSAIPWQSYYIDCTGQPPEYEFVRLLAARVLLLVICLSYFVSVGFVILPLFFLLSASVVWRVMWSSLFFLLVTLSFTPIGRSDYIRNHWVFRSVAEYFHFRVISATKLPKTAPFAFEVENPAPDSFKADKRYISTYWPHGVVSFGSFNWGTVFDVVNPPEGYGATGVASVVMKLPIIRQVFGVFKMVDSSYKSLLKTLKRENIALIPGGIAEMFLVDSEVEKIYLKNRKGFCKLALQSGASIIPLYIFGHTSILSLFPCVPASLSRKLGSSLVFIWPLIPRRKQLILSRGEYIDVDQVDNPTEEQINELHDRVIKAVKQMFEKTKKMCGPDWENKELEIY